MYCFLFIGVIVFKILNFIFIVVGFASLSTAFDDSRASKYDARESLKPSKPYDYYIQSPFEDHFDDPVWGKDNK
jgi:hypothetical protein